MGKGRGVVAIEDIPKGKVVFRDIPLTGAIYGDETQARGDFRESFYRAFLGTLSGFSQGAWPRPAYSAPFFRIYNYLDFSTYIFYSSFYLSV